jgi:N-acetylglutamate synthase-like GNAT family acetyltransferase
MRPEPCHDLSPAEVAAIEDRIYAFNAQATGHDDAAGLGFVIRDANGEIVAATTGYTWAEIAEIRQMWVDEGYRGSGIGRALLAAMIAEARARHVKRIWVSSHDFQAPAMYEKAGFVRMAELTGWPADRVNVFLCKTLE